MIEFRRMMGGGDAAAPVRDFKLNNAYAAVAKRNDVVKLDAAGDVIAAAAADVAVLGVFVGPVPKMTADTVTYGKVITAPEAVYEINASGGTPVADGTGYPVGVTAGDYFLNAAARTTPVFKVLGVALPNGKYEVVISGRQLI